MKSDNVRYLKKKEKKERNICVRGECFKSLTSVQLECRIADAFQCLILLAADLTLCAHDLLHDGFCYRHHHGHCGGVTQPHGEESTACHEAQHQPENIRYVLLSVNMHRNTSEYQRQMYSLRLLRIRILKNIKIRSCIQCLKKKENDKSDSHARVYSNHSDQSESNSTVQAPLLNRGCETDDPKQK